MRRGSRGSVMRERIACLEERVVAQNTPGPIFFKTNRADPFRDRAPDHNPNTDPNPNPKPIHRSAFFDATPSARGLPTHYSSMRLPLGP